MKYRKKPVVIEAVKLENTYESICNAVEFVFNIGMETSLIGQWFFGKDGQQYKSVWGKSKVLEAKDILGLKPSNSANWYLQVGDNENAVFVAGCRIHYAMICLNKPLGKEVYCVE
jgi:hypothetical protein